MNHFILSLEFTGNRSLYVDTLDKAGPEIAAVEEAETQDPLRRRSLRKRVPEKADDGSVAEPLRHPLHAPDVRARKREGQLARPELRVRQGQDRGRGIQGIAVRELSGHHRDGRLSDGEYGVRGTR